LQRASSPPPDRAAADANRCVHTPLGLAFLNRAQRVRERLAVAARSSGVHNPALSRALDEERMEWDEKLRERERIPPPIDIDLDCGSDARFSHDRRC
jgi:hypothetical protein